MSRKNKITSFQLYSVLFLSRIFVVVTYIAGLSSGLSATDEVIATALTGLFLCITAVPAAVFMRKTEGSLIQRAQAISSVTAKIMSVLYLIYFVAFGSVTAVSFGYFTGSVMFPETNILFFIFITLAASFYIAYKGIEAIGRASVIFLIPVLFAFAFVFLTQIKDFDFLNFDVPFSDSAQEITASAFSSAGMTGEIVFIFFLAPYVSNVRAGGLYKWISAVTFVMILTEVFLTGVLGAFGDTQLFDMYALTVTAKFGFVERLDALISCLWLLCSGVKIALIMIVCRDLLQGLTGGKRQVLYLFLSSIMIFAGAIPLAGSITVFFDFLTSCAISISFTVYACLLPSLVMIAEKIKERISG